MKTILTICSVFLSLLFSQRVVAQTEAHRPLYHFTPKAHWMNDPNGMVYHNGTYHLFFQYYPGATVWGPMHWGHATSTDMINWEEQPIALYPDSLGYIFSGSAVVDVNNTSGFAKNGETPLVAIFTHHDPVKEAKKTNLHETQSIAYSLDAGKTWTKYANNPVLKNPGIPDFRDPKVSWYAAQKKWIMTLATKDRITFYSSPNLKDWEKESDFGATMGAHGGVWECPDLLEMNYMGKKLWVLLVSINPGGPNGGSATQYFVGNFDGKNFTPADTLTRWMDYGTDNYAGVTFSNIKGKNILMGWMSNWQYANQVPTDKWRSATTIPRELGIEMVSGNYYLTSKPIAGLKGLEIGNKTFGKKIIQKTWPILTAANASSTYKIEITASASKSFSFRMYNQAGEELIVGYQKNTNQFFIDRVRSGKKDFEAGFARVQTAPRISKSNTISLEIFMDVASVELFADKGLTVMTAIQFPNTPLDMLSLSGTGLVVEKLNINNLKPAIFK